MDFSLVKGTASAGDKQGEIYYLGTGVSQIEVITWAVAVAMLVSCERFRHYSMPARADARLSLPSPECQ